MVFNTKITLYSFSLAVKSSILKTLGTDPQIKSGVKYEIKASMLLLDM